MSTELTTKDISDESIRRYVLINKAGQEHIITINNPVAITFRSGGSTHRITDSEGVVHCVPAPEVFGCKIEWEVKDGKDPVRF